MATIAIPARTFTVAPPPPARVSPAAEQPRCEQPPRTTHSTPAPAAPARQPSRPATPPAQLPAQAKPVKPRFQSRGNGPLYERYRPRKWREIVGQDAALRRLEILRRSPCGLTGRAYFLLGASGTGKSSIGRCIADHIADEHCQAEFDAKELTPAVVREIERESHTYGMFGKPGRCYTVNEAHALTKSVVAQLLTTLERIPAHVAWVLTTTPTGQKAMFDENIDAGPLLSRCVELSLAPTTQLVEPFARRLMEVAQAEGLCGKPLDWFVRLVQSKGCNLRACYQEVETGAAL